MLTDDSDRYAPLNPENREAMASATSQPSGKESAAGHRYTQTRIRIRISKSYHREPVISRLISQHGLTVNITAALLGATQSRWRRLVVGEGGARSQESEVGG